MMADSRQTRVVARVLAWLTPRRKAYWAHPSTHEIFKLMPHNPPERGQAVLVDGKRHEVVACPVKWEGRAWTMKRGVKVRPIP
jgi:hypothetical protein